MAEELKFYSLEQVAELLQVTYQMVYAMVRKGELPARRIGKLYRIMESDLQAFLDQSRTTSASESLVCARCGRKFASALSLSASCRVCGAPICKICAEIDHADVCEIHQATSEKATAETKKAE